jgi:membrane protease YdiL (CAAX protease family)
MRRFYIALTLAPLIRILSLSLPLSELGLSVIYWYLLIGIVLYIAAFFAARIADLGWRRIGWSWKGWPLQVAFGFIGVALGWIEYMILRPAPLAASLAFSDLWIPALVLLFFTGFLEELIFRGLIQSTAMHVLGRYGLVYGALVFASLHLGFFSLVDLMFVLAVGLLFGWMVWKTGALLGVSLAHGITNICLYLIFPLLLAAHPLAHTTAQNPAAPAASRAAAPIQDSTTPASMLVDDTDATFLHAGNALELIRDGGFGGSFLRAPVSASLPTVVVTWLPALPQCGRYEVRVFLPPLPNATRSARYQIHHMQSTTFITLDQNQSAGGWMSLGDYLFDPADQPSLQLANMTGEDSQRWVGFDAAGWWWLGPCGNATGTT